MQRVSPAVIDTAEAPRGDVTFVSLNKKVTKEISLGEALSVALPTPKPPSPKNPSRRALGEIMRCIDFRMIGLSPLNRTNIDAAGDS